MQLPIIASAGLQLPFECDCFPFVGRRDGHHLSPRLLCLVVGESDLHSQPLFRALQEPGGAGLFIFGITGTDRVGVGGLCARLEVPASDEASSMGVATMSASSSKLRLGVGVFLNCVHRINIEMIWVHRVSCQW